MQASHYRAEIALAKGDMSRALGACDAGFSALAEAQGGRALPPPAPANGPVSWDFPRILAAQRAFALAALGRDDEALAELAWANGFPTDLPRLRVRWVKRLRSGDWDAAAHFVEAWDPALVLSAREEVLVDLLRFVARPGTRSEPEAARLRAETRRLGDMPQWLEAVAPGLVAAFERTAREIQGAIGAQEGASPPLDGPG
jgi:hypothetical protein